MLNAQCITHRASAFSGEAPNFDSLGWSWDEPQRIPAQPQVSVCAIQIIRFASRPRRKPNQCAAFIRGRNQSEPYHETCHACSLMQCVLAICHAKRGAPHHAGRLPPALAYGGARTSAVSNFNLGVREWSSCPNCFGKRLGQSCYNRTHGTFRGGVLFGCDLE